MQDTRLIVLAWHRPDYLRSCLESWTRVRGFSDLRQVTVRCGRSDSDVEAANELVALKTLGAHVPVRFKLDDPEDAAVKGPDLALGKEIDAAFADDGCEFVIECDEDVVVSDDALEYVAWARSLEDFTRRWEPGTGVHAVCLHNALGQGWLPRYDDSAANQETARLLPEFTSWCFGFSRKSWEETWRPEWDWNRSSGSHPLQHGWEWQMHRQAARGLRVMVPDASRCQNIGVEGGRFSTPGIFESSQAASFREHRDPVFSYRLAEAPFCSGHGEGL